MAKKLKKLFLVDGQGIVYRAFYALPKLTTSYGQLINAAYGFTLVMIRLLQEKKPDGLVVAFDTPKPTFRHLKYSQYKAQREKMPQELIDQLPMIKEIIKKMNIPMIEAEGYEADDIIGSIANQVKHSEYQSVIVTGDRDLLQLIDEDTEILFMQKGVTQVKSYQLESVKEMLGFSPDLIPDYIGLKGDASDNIPGIPGIGEKTAKNLIQTYGKLENILTNFQNIENVSLRKKIEEYKEQALLSKALGQIKKDMGLNLDISHLNYQGPDYFALKKLFEKYEFKKLIEKIPQPENVSQNQGNEFILHEVKNEEELEQVAHRIHSKKILPLIYIPGKGVLSHEGQGIALILEDDVFLVRLQVDSQLKNLTASIPEKKVKEVFSALFQDDKVEKIGLDLKDICHHLCDDGFFLKQPYFDIKIAAYLLNPSKQEYSLISICKDYLGDDSNCLLTENHGSESAVEKEKNICSQAKLLISLKEKLSQLLIEKNLEALFQEIELPLIPVIFQMEKAGIKIDIKFLEKISQQFSRKIGEIQRKVFELAGEEFNLNSPKQLSNILFQKLKLPVVKKVKTGLSTNAQVLHKLSEKHEIVAKILEYREIEKLKNTYIDKLPNLINVKSGRIHTSFNQTGTTTGRLSSNNPNLQNIPTRTELGNMIRKAFIAEKGHIFLSADYSQIELRILAHLSQDQSLLEAFLQDKDIHSYTAGQIFNVDQNIVSNEMRRIAKTINFGIIYGMSSFGLANHLDISREDAQLYIQTYFQRYHRVREFIDEQISLARKNKFVKTMLNRIRYLEGIDSPDRNIREFYERTAINTPIQGTAADLIKIAMIRISNEFEKEKLPSGLVLQIHDELIFEIPESQLKKRELIVKKIMENSLQLSIPLIVNFKTGHCWGELE
ncbi:MAG: DNA polymerase I [Candidatus Atribacteria bacterium]|nr:DNA polymerase I [Candidatus Atribacteria bacterium]